MLNERLLKEEGKEEKKKVRKLHLKRILVLLQTQSPNKDFVAGALNSGPLCKPGKDSIAGLCTQPKDLYY